MIDIVAWVSSSDTNCLIPSDRRFRVTLDKDSDLVVLRNREGQTMHTFTISCPPIQHRSGYIFYDNAIEYRATVCPECTKNLKDEFDDYIGEL